MISRCERLFRVVAACGVSAIAVCIALVSITRTLDSWQLANRQAAGGGEAVAPPSEARARLARSPLDAAMFRALAADALTRNDMGSARRLLQAASRLDPHASETHLWLMEDARAHGDLNAVVAHADLLMRISPGAALFVAATTNDLLGDQEFRRQLVARLGSLPPWRDALLRAYAGDAAPDDVMALFQTMTEAAVPPNSLETSAFARRLLDGKDIDDLRRYRSSLLGGANRPAPAIYDASFDDLPGAQPLTWEALPRAGGQATWRASDGAEPGALTLTHDGFSSSGTLARQLIFLPPGVYSVTFALRSPNPDADRRFALEVVCIDGRRLFRAPISVSGSASEPMRFSTPTDCSAEWFAFAPEPFDRRSVAQLMIDKVTLSTIDANDQLKALTP